jgi:hypothetical protein
MLARFGRVLLVFAVLLAQQTALAHQYWHATPKVAAEKSLPSKGDVLCDLHDLLGTVLGVAGGAAPALAFLALSEPGFTAAPAAVRQAQLLAPHSRDPPLIS